MMGAMGPVGAGATTASSAATEAATNSATVAKNQQAIKNAFDSVQNLKVNSAINLMNSAGDNAKSIRL